MIGLVLGSPGMPFAPWHAAQSCTLASILGCACAGTLANARTAAAAIVVGIRLNMVCPRLFLALNVHLGMCTSIGQAASCARAQRAGLPDCAAHHPGQRRSDAL